MDREHALENLEVIKAFAEGKAVQYKEPDGEFWFDASDGGSLSFFDGWQYRIKPEPEPEQKTFPPTAQGLKDMVTYMANTPGGASVLNYDFIVNRGANRPHTDTIEVTLAT